MLKKTITYTNFNDEEVREDFYFHLSKAEVVQMELSAKGGLQESLTRIVNSGDGKAIIEEFNALILRCVGRRSPDGKNFYKTDEIVQEFKACGAFDVLFLEIVTNADAAAKFVQGVLPTDLAEEASKAVEQMPHAAEVDTKPHFEVAPGIYQKEKPKAIAVSSAELREMPESEYEVVQEGIRAGTHIVVG